jgi:hypothetical protein
MSRNKKINIRFSVVMQYDILVLFENFYEYYNFIFEELELNLKVSLAVLV